LIGWSDSRNAQDYQRSELVETDAEGRFSVQNLMPGQYYLGANIWETPEPAQTPFPRTYYPGVAARTSARPLTVAEGRSLEDVVFRLPDYGKKRRLNVRVVSGDGVVVPHAIVENGPVNQNGAVVSSIGESQYTDDQGEASFDVWAVSEYRITVRLVLPKAWYQSETMEVPAGASDDPITIVLNEFQAHP
jgi:hypothetical protein